MGNINGAKEDENCRSRYEEKRLYCVANTGGSRNARHKGGNARNQSQRIDRANSQGASFNELGSTDDGGIVGQLIDEYRNQVAIKRAEIESIQIEVQQLESRIHQFEIIEEALRSQTKEVS